MLLALFGINETDQRDMAAQTQWAVEHSSSTEGHM